MDLVCYVIALNNGKFKPFLSMIVPSDFEDDDKALFVSATKDAMDTLEKAQDFITKEGPPSARKFLNPIKPSPEGLTWLSELEAANVPEQV